MKNIVITFGGDSCEHDISIITAFTAFLAKNKAIKKYLIYIKNNKFYLHKSMPKIGDYSRFNEKKFNQVSFINGEMIILKKLRKRIKIDCSIICNHGGSGENGALSGYFETVGIPCTSSGLYANSLFIDKVYAKSFYKSKKLPTLPYVVYNKGENLSKINLEFPLIVKPANLGSSVGVGIANNIVELSEKIDFALNFDKKLLIEKALLDFVELNCAIYRKNGELIISDIEKPICKTQLYDFDKKYLDTSDIDKEFPAKISKQLEYKVKLITKKIYNESGASGVVRIDYLVQGEKVYVNEVNTVPGSLAFYLFSKKEIKIENLIDDLVEESINEIGSKKNLINHYDSDLLKNFDTTKLNIGVKK